MAEPVIKGSNHLFVEPVMPEAPVDIIGQEISQVHIAIDENGKIAFVYPPLVFKYSENGTYRFFEWVKLSLFNNQEKKMASSATIVEMPATDKFSGSPSTSPSV